jgi:hypothetical protein
MIRDRYVFRSFTATCTYNFLYTYHEHYQLHGGCQSKVCDSYKSYSEKCRSANFGSFVTLASWKYKSRSIGRHLTIFDKNVGLTLAELKLG